MFAWRWLKSLYHYVRAGSCRIDDRVQVFANRHVQILGEVLSSNDFSFHRRRLNHNFALYIYRSEERYIEVGANTYFLDGPAHCFVHLGEGSDEWIETDWNKITLWHMMPAPKREYSEYLLSDYDSVEDTLQSIRNDLTEHAADFLSGDLERFRAERRECVRKREPYKIHSLNGIAIEPQSAALKERYSSC